MVGVLTERQEARFHEHISNLEIDELRSTGLSIRACYQNLVDAMTSYNWYIQNPAIEMIESLGPDQVSKLNEDQQVILGRNILQCAEGRAKEASRFIRELSASESSWPLNLLRGILLESFVSERNVLRFKDRHLRLALSALTYLGEAERHDLIVDVINVVDAAVPDILVDHTDCRQFAEMLKDHDWAEPLAVCLNAKAEYISADSEN